MPLDDGPGDSRTSSPSLTDRMRGLATRRSFASSPFGSRGRGFESHDDDESDQSRSRDGSVQSFGERITRPPSVPESQYCEDARKSLDVSNTLDNRVDSAMLLSQTIGSYSLPTRLLILDAAKHLGDPSAEPKARKAYFNILEAAVINTALPDEDKCALFKIAKAEAPADLTYYQVRAFRALTKDAVKLKPLDRGLVPLLPGLLHKQYTETSAARKKNKGSSRGSSLEEKGLFSLLDLVTNILNIHPTLIPEAALEAVVKEVVRIAERTISKRDMQRAVQVLRSAVEHSSIPEKQLSSTIEVLCAIVSAISEYQPTTMDVLKRLLQSKDQQHVISILFQTLKLAPNERHSHIVGGALMMICLLVSRDDDSLPAISFSELIEALDEVHFASRRTRRDCLRTMYHLVKEPNLTESILKSNWDKLVKVILTAVGDANYIHDRTSEPITIRTSMGSSPSSTPEPPEETPAERSVADDIIQSLNNIASSFNSLWYRLTPEQRQAVSLYYYKLRLILPKDTLRNLIKQLSSDAYFDPGSEDWKSHQLEILRLFVWDRDMDIENCSIVVKVLTQAVSVAHGSDYEHFHMVVLRLLNDLGSQLTLTAANDLAEFAAATWKNWQPPRMNDILERFWPLLNIKDMTSDGEANSWGPEIKLNTVSLLFVKLFLQYLPHHPENAKHLFEYMTEIAKAGTLPPSVRIPIMRLLARIRCDSLGRIIVVDVADALGLAGVISRTEATIGPIGKYSLDRVSLHEEPPPSRSSKSKSLSSFSARISRGPERTSRPPLTPPLWMYPGAPGLPQDPPKEPSSVLSVHTNETPGLKVGEWLLALIEILQQPGHWEVYSYVIVHLPSQLSHPSFFAKEKRCIQHLRSVLVSQILTGKFQEPPANSHVYKGDVALCLFHSLTMLLGCSDYFSRGEQDDIVRAFLAGIGGWERTARTCIQSLAICCHQIPWAVTRALTAIVQKMSQIITQSNLAVDILEFLGGLARLPDLYTNFREEEYRTVFAVCTKYLEHAREEREKLASSVTSEADHSTNRASGISVKSASTSDSGQNVDLHRDLPQYVFALAYHVITIWFLSLKLVNRSDHVGWITANLAWKDPSGFEYMEEQSQVTLDMMFRTAYLDLGETSPATIFRPSDGIVMRKNWILGLSIVTIETATGTGLTQIIKRQATGTTYGVYRQHTAPLPAHHVPMPDDSSSLLHGPEARLNVFPNHVFLGLHSNIAPMPTPMEPICLPDNDLVKRAITTFDRNDTVDGYKVGVIYVGNGQEQEAEILANTQGSRSFDMLLEGLGTKVPLKGATFNTQGLDRESDLDGTHTYAWRDRVAEIVFHIPSMMPTDRENDPNCVGKKRHIGNDFVNIIFNDSGLPFKFDTFPSQFNCVNIVITPENKPTLADTAALEHEAQLADEERHKAFYTVQTVSVPSFPLVSPAASYKLLPLANLPNLVRQMALQASVFSHVWTQRAGGEVISAWRNRLREIHKLRERFVNTGTSTSAKFPGAKASKTYVEGDTFVGKVAMGGLAEEEGVMAGLDFSRWAGPNPTSS